MSERPDLEARVVELLELTTQIGQAMHGLGDSLKTLADSMAAIGAALDQAGGRFDQIVESHNPDAQLETGEGEAFEAIVVLDQAQTLDQLRRELVGRIVRVRPPRDADGAPPDKALLPRRGAAADGPG